MTNDTKMMIHDLRRAGFTLNAIAELTDTTISSIKTYCSRNRIHSILFQECLSCGKPLTQLPGKKRSKYCCKKCKDDWWNHYRKAMKHGRN